MSQLPFFPRPELKHHARISLRGHWTVAVAITLLTFAFLALFSYLQLQPTEPTVSVNQNSFNSMVQSLEATSVSTEAVLWSQFIGLVSGLLVNGVLGIAATKWYLSVVQNRRDTGFGDFISNFSLGLKGILAYIWQMIWITIWSIVYLIPLFLVIALSAFIFDTEFGAVGVVLIVAGVIFYGVLIVRKSLSYSQMFYIIADNPAIGTRQSMRLSIDLTRDRLFDLFMLGLSFIGWVMLMFITAFIASLYVVPYMSATFASTYLWLRDRALDAGMIDPATFGLMRMDPSPETYPEQEIVNDRIDEMPNATHREIRDLDEVLDQTMPEEYNQESDRKE